MKLTKQQAQAHREACALLDADRPLTEGEQEFVLTHWHESAEITHILDGAFFSPLGLARDLAIHVVGTRILDLGAGIGGPSWACRRNDTRRANGEPAREFVCIERNPAYVAVGRRILPEATWICADYTTLDDLDLGHFDTAISNPPFGYQPHQRRTLRYLGRRMEYHTIDLAADHAHRGIFIIPQGSAPFRYSGQPRYSWKPTEEYERFHRETGLTLQVSSSIDTSYYDDDWRGARTRTEVVICDFHDRPAQGRQTQLTQLTLLSHADHDVA